MTYRDDHDAALARVHALEDALARERSEDEAREERIDVLEKQLRDERSKLASAEAELATLRPEPLPPQRPKPAEVPPIANEASSKRPALGVAVVLGGVLVLVLVLVIATSTRKQTPEEHVPDKVRPPQVALPDDISMYLDEARARRDDLLPGARLIELRARGVDEHGALHREYGVVEFELHRNNPKPAAPPAVDRPIGAPKPAEPEWDRVSCATLKRTAAGWDETSERLSEMGIDLGTCMFANTNYAAEIEPRCTTSAIWAMAIADGAPPGAIANLETSGGAWDFEIDDERAPFSKTYRDDCIPAEGER